MELRKITRSKFKLSVPAGEFEPEMLPWLESIFGTGGRRGTWKYGWGHWAKGHDSVHQIWFKQEENATLFLLRWANNG